MNKPQPPSATQKWFDSEIQTLHKLRETVLWVCRDILAIPEGFLELRKSCGESGVHPDSDKQIRTAECDAQRRLIAATLAHLVGNQRPKLSSLLHASVAWIPRTPRGTIGGPPGESLSWCAYLEHFLDELHERINLFLHLHSLEQNTSSAETLNEAALCEQIFRGMINECQRLVPWWLDFAECYSFSPSSQSNVLGLAAIPEPEKIVALGAEAARECDVAITIVTERKLTALDLLRPAKSPKGKLARFANADREIPKEFQTRPMSPGKAAEFLRCSRKTVIRDIEDRQLRAIPISQRRIIFDTRQVSPPRE